MRDFKAGDLVKTEPAKNCLWRLMSLTDGYWLATDENDGFNGRFPESWIVGYADNKASTHYTPDASGKDYLARCEETYSRDEMIGAYRFTIGKYVDRMGKKQGEPVEKELDKIIDYATRAKEWLGRQ